ncbi:ankyrin repeat-containing domain protein [Trichoderma chlorosporum]
MSNRPSIKSSSAPINPDVVDPQKPLSETENLSPNQIDNPELQETPPSLHTKDNAISIRDLWNVAYERLRQEDEHLINAYEAGIRQSLSASISLTIGSNLSVRDRMDKILRSKMDEVNQDSWKIRFRSSEVHTEDIVQPILSIIRWANEYISSALSSNPYASMAWAGVSLLLPVRLDIVKWDNWNELLVQVQEQERQFVAIEQLWRDSKYDEESLAAERRHQYTMHQWSDIGLDLLGLRTAIESAQAEGERWLLLDWLCSVDPSEMYNAARDKHKAGTGDWLVKESRQFGKWETSPSSLLWLHGNAGSGKSILSSVVIKHLHDQHTSDPLTALAYFYFSFSDIEKQKVASMLTSLIKQLCSQRPDTPQLLRNLHEFKNKGQRPDIQTLETILIAVAKGFTAVYIVIDALDECPTLQGERRKLLNSLRNIITNAPANLHVLCTSRKEADIDAAMSLLLVRSGNAAATKSEAETGASIDLSAHRDKVDRDIGLYIDLTLASEEYNSWPKDIKGEAKRALIEKGDGIKLRFQYVFSQFETLQHLSSVSLIRKALQDLPTGLDATYDRLLLRLNPAFQDQIINCLKWLAFSNEMLTVDQLAQVFILFPKRAIPFDETEKLFCSEDVLKYLPGLFVVEHVTKYISPSFDSCTFPYIRLAHFSVKEYLVSNRIFEGPATAFSFSEIDDHLQIAHCCLAFHLHVPYERDIKGCYPWNEHHLGKYAYEHWASHLEMVPRACWPAEVTQAAIRALTTRYPSFYRMLFHSGNFGTADLSDLSRNLRQPQCYTARCGYLQLTELLLSQEDGANVYLTQEDFDVALHNAAVGGRTAVVKFCLSKGANVNSESESFGDVLQATAHEGHDAIVSILLDSGADINAQRGKFGTALQAAAYWGHLSVMKLLVSRGADVNAWSDESGCALTSAASGSETDCLQYLLDVGAEINKGSGSSYGTALHQALSVPHKSKACLRLLLERGADVNAPGGKYGYPLQAACTSEFEYSDSVGHADDFDDVKLLLDSGADVNAKGGVYGNALQAACRFKGVDVVKLLIDRGAWIHAKGGDFGTALQAACSRSSLKMGTVKLLLENGADPNIQGGIWERLVSGVSTSKQGQPRSAKRSYQSKEVVQLLLDNGVELNAQGGLYGSALQAACAAGNVEVVHLLIDRGVDVNAEGGKYGTALQAACTLRYLYDGITDDEDVEILEALLENGANVHTQGGFYGSAWHAAAANLEPGSLLSKLLDRGVDVNDARGKQYPTALLAVLANKARDSSHLSGEIRFLLDHGADVNLTVGTFGSPLHHACAHEDDENIEDAVIYMLENCADLDVNQRGGSFGSALQAAAWTGKTESVRMLLSKGADANALGGKCGSPLNAAVFRGNWDVVEVLLDGGAVPDCFQLEQSDDAWLAQIREEFGRGAVERYRVFWEKQKEMSLRGNESVSP